MTDAPTPEQAAGLDQKSDQPQERPRLQVGSLLRQQTYTWTCPRCGWKHPPALTPLYSPSCPQCLYPEPPPKGFVGVADPDEQATEIARMAAAMNPEDTAAREALAREQADEAATYDKDGNLIPAAPKAQRPMPEAQSEPSAPAAPARLEAGWLAVCMAEALRQSPESAEGVTLPPDTLGYAEAVVALYEGERWRMLCGCLAGVHDDTFDAMADAHPERVRR